LKVQLFGLKVFGMLKTSSSSFTLILASHFKDKYPKVIDLNK